MVCAYEGGDDMIQNMYAYNNIYKLFNISRKDLSRNNALKTSSTSPASVATSMLFGTSLNKTYTQMINYDAYSDQASFSEDFRTKLKDLHDSANDLTDPSGDAYASRSADFSSDAVSITVEDDADIAEYSIDVQQIATVQTNATDAVDADAVTQLSDALNHIELIVDGEVTDLLIERSPDQSNLELFTAVADAINAQDVDFTADVVTTDAGQASLQVTGNASGDGQDFQISGSLADAIDLSTVDIQAQDAILRVDDQVITSASNLVELDNGKIGIQVNAETTVPFDLHIDVSGTGALAAAKRFANKFSQSMIYLSTLNSIEANLLQKQFVNTVTEHEAEFEELGIHLNENKELTIDEQKFEAQFEQNSEQATQVLKEFKTAVGKVEKKAAQALKIPTGSFRPAPKLPANVKAYNLSYNQNLRPVPVNNLFTRGSIIDVFF